MLGTFNDLDLSLYKSCCYIQRYPRLMQLARLCSRSGDGYLYGAFGLLLLAPNDLHSMLVLKAGLVAFLIELPCFIGLKSLIRRDRPFVRMGESLAAIKPADKFSMPSGHAAAAFLMATLVSFFFVELMAVAYCWATLVALSRVVLGVHYPGDILAGAALGSSCTLLGIMLASSF